MSTRQSKVYLIGSGPLVKIGVSSDPDTRRQELQVGRAARLSVLRSEPCREPYDTEKHLHSRLWAYHVEGEWFMLPRRVLRYLLDCETLTAIKGYPRYADD